MENSIDKTGIPEGIRITDNGIIYTGAKEEMPERKVLVIDIETYGRTDLEDPFIGNLVEEKKDKRFKDPEKIAENVQKITSDFALHPTTGKVILFGSLDGITNEYEAYSGNEADILVRAWDKLMWAYGNGYLIVSKGGKRFDIPYMLMRSLVWGVEGIKNSCLVKSLLMKYNDTYHCDLETYLTEGGLYSWGYLMGLTDQFKNNGNEIKAMYEANDMEQIVEKNHEDLRLTLEIFRRLSSWI